MNCESVCALYNEKERNHHLPRRRRRHLTEEDDTNQKNCCVIHTLFTFGRTLDLKISWSIEPDNEHSWQMKFGAPKTLNEIFGEMNKVWMKFISMFLFIRDQMSGRWMQKETGGAFKGWHCFLYRKNCWQDCVAYTLKKQQHLLPVNLPQ